MIIEDTAIVYRRGNNAEEAHPEEYKVTLPFESKDYWHRNVWRSRFIVIIVDVSTPY